MRTNQTESFPLTAGSIAAGSWQRRTGPRFRDAPLRPCRPAGLVRCWQAGHSPAGSRPGGVPACRLVAVAGAAVLRHSWDNGRPGDRARKPHRKCTRKSRSAPRSNPAANRNHSIRNSVVVQASHSPRCARHSSTVQTRAKRSASTSSVCALISLAVWVSALRRSVMAKVSVASLTKST